MSWILDPLAFDDTKIAVPDIQFKQDNYGDSQYPPTGSLSMGTKIVDAAIVEETCPTCHGKGVVKKKVPK
jgi:hypothetical protein